MGNAIEKRSKPVVAYINDYAYSAAYIGFSGCDLMVANTDYAQVGSIGVLTTIVDYRKQLEIEGINVIELYATQSKDKNADIRSALNGDMTALQAYIDKVCGEQAIEPVLQNRSSSKDTKEKWASGKTFDAKEALALGLIDKVDTLENVLNYF